MKRAAAIFFFTLLPVLLFAQPAQRMFITKQSAHSLGVAGAFTSMADDQSAFDLNPAGISRMAGKRYLGIQGGSVERWKNWSAGATFIDAKTEDPLHWGLKFNSFSFPGVREDHYSLGLSVELFDIFNLGVVHHLTYLGRSVDDWVYSLDVGTMVFMGDHISLGAALSSAVKASDESGFLDREVNGGVSYNDKKFRLGVDYSYGFQSKAKRLKSGIELMLTEHLIFRSGYSYEMDLKKHAYSVGSGVKIGDSFGVDTGWMDFLKSRHFIYLAGMNFWF